MKDQYAFSGVQRTLAGDYVKNLEFANAPGTWSDPNMYTFDSSKGYLKICASLVLKMTRR